jgi:hypothetical protein
VLAAAESDNVVIVQGASSEEPAVPVSLEDPSVLRDKSGQYWSGVILNTDMVQKTMPGNRCVAPLAVDLSILSPPASFFLPLFLFSLSLLSLSLFRSLTLSLTVSSRLVLELILIEH